MLVAKLAMLGAEIKSFAMEDGSTVGRLFEMAEENFVQGAVSINGAIVNENTILRDGNLVFIARQTKGNLPFELQIIRLGAAEPMIAVAVEEGTTVLSAFNALDAGRRSNFIRADGTQVYQEYRLGNGSLIDANAPIVRPASGTERIICATKTKGN